MKYAIQTNVWSNEIHANLPELMSQIGRAGYDGFEIGAHRLDLSEPDQIIELLRRHGLQVSAMHLHGELHNPDTISEKMTFYKEAIIYTRKIQAPFVLLSGRPKDSRKTEQELVYETKSLNQIGMLCANQQLVLCYHNHYWELSDNLRELEYLVNNTLPALVSLALDVAWVYRSGYDPADIIRKFKSRIRYLHLKDTLADHFIEPGKGLLDFKSILGEARTLELSWLAIERDEVLSEAFASAKSSLGFIKDTYNG
jgi:sugar phosphate isomerase/epimerase